ncbi:hypothetical protein OAI75_01785 [Woeseiaceae bacterium]|nr:hypothetical protein [Woeseiaceae bacterium]
MSNKKRILRKIITVTIGLVICVPFLAWAAIAENSFWLSVTSFYTVLIALRSYVDSSPEGNPERTTFAGGGLTVLLSFSPFLIWSWTASNPLWFYGVSFLTLIFLILVYADVFERLKDENKKEIQTLNQSISTKRNTFEKTVKEIESLKKKGAEIKQEEDKLMLLKRDLEDEIPKLREAIKDEEEIFPNLKIKYPFLDKIAKNR